MSWWQRIKFALYFALYEGGKRWSKDRSYIPGYVQDARFDADSATRSEIVRKSRYFEANGGILNKLCDLFEQFTVGAGGLPFTPDSSNEQWNMLAQDAWDGWCRFCDLTSLQSFATIQSLIARTWFIDGEVFLLKTRGDSGRPRIQLIEGHRVCTPTDRYTDEGRKIVDGIEVDGNGRPSHYWIASGLDGDTYTRVPAESVIHIFEPSRPGMYRGLPFCYPVINDLHDLDDLEQMLMKVAKDAAEITLAYFTESGEMPNLSTIRKNRFSETVTATNATDITKTRQENIRKVLGPRNIALKKDEKVEQLIANRPSAMEQAWIDYKTSKVCAGIGITKLLVYPWSMQGTVTRADLDVQATFFKTRSMVLADAFRRVYEWVMADEIRTNRALAKAPVDWYKVTTLPPRSVNVDVGRNSSAMLAEYEARLRTAESIFLELGQDYRKAFRQIGKEEKLKMQIEQEMELPAGSLSKAIKEAVKTASPPPTEPTQPDPLKANGNGLNGHNRLLLT